MFYFNFLFEASLEEVLVRVLFFPQVLTN